MGDAIARLAGKVEVDPYLRRSGKTGKVSAVVKHTRTSPTIKVSLRFQETEHEGDLERYWQGGESVHEVDKNGQMKVVGRTPPVAQIAAKHNVRKVGMQALTDVDEDSDYENNGWDTPSEFPSDEFYEGGGRYEEGIIDVVGTERDVKAFLKEMGQPGTYGGIAKAEYVGKPPVTRMTTKPTPNFNKFKSASLGGPTESFGVFANGHQIATVDHYGSRRSGYSGGYTPEHWKVGGMSGVWQSQYPTKEAALKDVKKNHQPRPVL